MSKFKRKNPPINVTQAEPAEVLPALRESFMAQLPIVAAILAIGEEKIDLDQLAADAIELCRAIEEGLDE